LGDFKLSEFFGGLLPIILWIVWIAKQLLLLEIRCESMFLCLEPASFHRPLSIRPPPSFWWRFCICLARILDKVCMLRMAWLFYGELVELFFALPLTKGLRGEALYFEIFGLVSLKNLLAINTRAMFSRSFAARPLISALWECNMYVALCRSNNFF